jgi:hypothetical protein
MQQKLNFEEWIAYGLDHGYCSEQFCSTHDGYPMHETEEKAWDEGFDPCLHVVRLGSYEDWNIGE